MRCPKILFIVLISVVAPNLPLINEFSFAQTSSDRKAEATRLLDRGMVLLNDEQKYQEALQILQQALVIFRAIQDRSGEAKALQGIGDVYLNLNDYKKAIEYQQQSLTLARSTNEQIIEYQSLGNLGHAYFSLGEYAKAIEFYQQQMVVGQQSGLGPEGALLNLGLLHLTIKDYPKAINYYEQMLALVKNRNDCLGESLALNELGTALFLSGQFVAAEKRFWNTINISEYLVNSLGANDSNKIGLFSSQIEAYRIQQQVLIAQNKPEAALELSERGRARAFAQLLTRRLLTNQVEQIDRSFMRIPICPNTPDSALVNYPTIRQVRPSASDAALAVTPLTIDQIKQIAKTENATLVEYSIIHEPFRTNRLKEPPESELFIWVIKPSGEITFKKSNLRPLLEKNKLNLADVINQSRSAIDVRGRGLIVASRVRNNSETNQSSQLKELHQILIKPIADLLPTNPTERVIFVPQGALFLVPFAALQDETGKYLIEKHTILITPSIQVLDLTRKQRQKVSGKEVLIVGNPKMPTIPSEAGKPSEKLENLPGAEAEAKAIASLFNTQAIIGSQATKSTILSKIPQAKIIHLATHGLLDDFQGLGIPGALALAPSGNDNGLLTASEILDLKINSELVVLSACDTGKGKITGDGVVGLSRSLIAAGAPSIIVSLWSVPDAPTATLMENFYLNLQQKSDKAQALRQAMLNTMKQHPNPKDWAAFTLIGTAE